MDNFHLLEEPRVFLAALQARPELRRRVMVIGVAAKVPPIRRVSAPFDVIDDFLSMPFSVNELFDKIEGNCSARGRVEWAAGKERLKRIEEGDALLAYGRQKAPQASERVYALSERKQPDTFN